MLSATVSYPNCDKKLFFYEVPENVLRNNVMFSAFTFTSSASNELWMVKRLESHQLVKIRI